MLEVCNDGIDNDCDGTANTCGLSGTVSLSAAEGVMVGEIAGDYAGHCVSGAGDVDGDGNDDLIVGAYRSSVTGEYAGAAYVVLAPVSGAASLTDVTRWDGEAGNDQAAYSVSGAGDVNGDGNDDLIVGAFGNDEGGLSAGAAYLVLGPGSGDIGLGEADAKLLGDGTDGAGFSVSSAGDVNADGLDDLLVGAPANSFGGSYGGGAYVVLGPVSGTIALTRGGRVPLRRGQRGQRGRLGLRRR